VIVINLTPNLYEVQRRHHQKNCKNKKINLFVVSIFHGHYEGTKILELIPLGNLFLLEKTHLNEINNNFFDDLNIMNL